VYVATLDAPLSAKEAAAAARRFASGTLTLEGDRSPLLPAALSVLEGGTTAEVALAEGRYHQVQAWSGVFVFGGRWRHSMAGAYESHSIGQHI
jgi:16S rRNA U516 pseudouridylate synthase RsuA-like enzyme